MKNCDTKDVLKEDDKTGDILYGKRALTSHKDYNLFSKDQFDINKIELFYSYFIYNMQEVSKDFIPMWIPNNLLLTTTKGLIWDWTSEDERKMTAESIRKYGMYFPIFTLPRGEIHNQIATDEELQKIRDRNLYNSYNGNHRIDAVWCLVEEGHMKGEEQVLVYIIPPVCQKSCTGFKYTPIDDHEEIELTKYKLKEPLQLIHMDYVEHEMKVTNWRQRTEIGDGVSMVIVDNQNVAFRIMTEMQNILEPVLTRYYEIHNDLPKGVKDMMRYFNSKDAFYEEDGATWKSDT